jgi:hypothetical protein
MNSQHQMKQFDTKIFHFGGLNWCQQQVSLSTTEIWQPLSLSSLLKRDQKIRLVCLKIKFEDQIKKNKILHSENV